MLKFSEPKFGENVEKIGEFAQNTGRSCARARARARESHHRFFGIPPVSDPNQMQEARVLAGFEYPDPRCPAVLHPKRGMRKSLICRS